MAEKLLLDPQIKAAAPRESSYTLGDGGGLFVLINPDGKKYFRFRYTFGKRQRLMQLGPYPRVSLEEARTERDKLRAGLRQGRDPITARRLGKLQEATELT